MSVQLHIRGEQSSYAFDIGKSVKLEWYNGNSSANLYQPQIHWHYFDVSALFCCLNFSARTTIWFENRLCVCVCVCVFVCLHCVLRWSGCCLFLLCCSLGVYFFIIFLCVCVFYLHCAHFHFHRILKLVILLIEWGFVFNWDWAKKQFRWIVACLLAFSRRFEHSCNMYRD